MLNTHMVGLEKTTDSNDSIVSSIVKAAKEKDLSQLRSLKEQGISLDVFNSEGNSAAIILAIEGNLEAIDCLFDEIDKKYHVIMGLMQTGNPEVVTYLNKIQMSQDILLKLITFLFNTNDDKHLYLLESFFIENHSKIDDYISEETKKSMDYKKYQIGAENLAFKGVESLALYIFNQLSENERDHNSLAYAAAKGGKLAFAKSIIRSKPQNPAKGKLPAALFFAKNGMRYFADYFFNSLPNDPVLPFQMACAAAESGNQQLVEKYLQLCKETIKVKGRRIEVSMQGLEVAFIAALSGHKQLAINLIEQSPTNPNGYLYVARRAAHEGKTEFAEEFINYLPEPERDYQSLISCAILNNQQATADFFINKLPINKRNFNFFACIAAKYGHLSLVTHFLNQLPENERNYLYVTIEAAENHHENIINYAYHRLQKGKRDGRYQEEEYACYAAKRGLKIATDFFINKIPVKQRRYGSIACCAGEGGHQHLAEHLIDHKNHFTQEKWYKEQLNTQVAKSAASCGHKDIAIYFLNKNSPENRNNIYVAEGAKDKYPEIAKYFENEYGTSASNASLQQDIPAPAPKAPAPKAPAPKAPAPKRPSEGLLQPCITPMFNAQLPIMANAPSSISNTSRTDAKRNDPPRIISSPPNANVNALPVDVKTLKSENESLKAEIAALKAENEELKLRLKDYSTANSLLHL